MYAILCMQHLWLLTEYVFFFFFWLLFVSLFAFWLDLGSVKCESVFLLGLAYMIQPIKVKQLK